MRRLAPNRVWLSADELAGVGEQACGYTDEGPQNRVDVWIVAPRGTAAP